MKRISKVKICGITNLEDALQAVECGADELGFNFYSSSQRYISPEKAGEIIARLPASAKSVGVFVNEPVESLLEIIQFADINMIQLHGDERITYITEVREKNRLPIIKAFRVDPTFSVDDALSWPIDFALFDTHSSQNYGGTGETFDWEHFGAEICLLFPKSAYLAGGLRPENVAEAIQTVRPYAVDVASGVESSPGKKDPNKVEEFIRNAKNA